MLNIEQLNVARPSLLQIYMQVNLSYNYGQVLHETFVSFVTFKVHMFKDSNLLCWKKESLRQPVMM